MANSVGGAIAEGIQGGWQMGLQSDAAAEHRREFDQEQTLRAEAQQRLQQQEQDRYGRLVDQSRITALQQRQATLEKLSQAAVAAGHQPSPGLMQEWAENAAQLDDMQHQIATTGRLVPQTAGLGATGLAAQPATPQPAVAQPPAPPAPAPTAPGGAPPLAGSAPPVRPQAGLGALPPTGMPATGAPPAPGGAPGLGPQSGPAGAPPPMDDSGSPIVGAAPPPPSPMPGGAPATGAVSSPTTSAVTPAQQNVAAVDQQSQDLASRLQSGQIGMGDVKPGDYALMIASATGHPPDQIDQVGQHIADWHAGMTTGNNGLVLQGLNGIFGPQIQQGVGTPSAYGGAITGKSIVGLDPAMSADGTIHPDKVIPRLQITTDVNGPDGQPLSYHAPMTQNRSTDPNDPVTAIPVADAANHIGAMGALVAAAQHPDAQALLAQGAKDPRVAQYLEDFKNATAPVDPAAAQVAMVQKYMQTWGTDWDTTVGRLQDAGIMKVPYRSHGAVAQTMDAATQLVQNGDAPDMASALAMLQKGGVTKQPTKYSPGAVAAPGSGAGAGGVPALGNPALTGPDYLKTLTPAMQQTVQNVANNPDLLKNIPTAKGQRAAVQNAVLQFKPDAMPGGTGGALGSRESTILTRTLTNANEAAQDLQNVTELPTSASKGLFGGRKPGTSLLGAGAESLTNMMTSQDVQSYNVLASGFQRSLAGIEAAGLAPGNVLSDQMGKVLLSEGDTEFTKMQKLAQTRQIIERGLDPVLANPKLAPAQRQLVTKIVGQIRSAVPYTQHDLTALKTTWNNGDDGATIQSVMAKNPAPTSAAAGGAPTQVHDAAGYAALPSGAHYLDPNGVARIKQ